MPCECECTLDLYSRDVPRVSESISASFLPVILGAIMFYAEELFVSIGNGSAGHSRSLLGVS